MNNRLSLALSLLTRMSAVAAIGFACARVIDRVAPMFVTGRGDATAFLIGHVKVFGHAMLGLATLSRDVLAFFGAA